MPTEEQRKAIEWCVVALEDRGNKVAEDLAETLRGMLTASAAPAEGRVFKCDGCTEQWCEYPACKPDREVRFVNLTDKQIDAAWSNLDLSDVVAPLSVAGQVEIRHRFVRSVLGAVATAPTMSEAARDEWADRCMGLAHRWAQATYMKGLSKPHEDFGEIRKELRRTLLERIERAAAKGESE